MEGWKENRIKIRMEGCKDGWMDGWMKVCGGREVKRGKGERKREKDIHRDRRTGEMKREGVRELKCDEVGREGVRGKKEEGM